MSGDSVSSSCCRDAEGRDSEYAGSIENTLKQLASGQVNLHHLPTPAELRIKHVTLLPFFCLTYKTVMSTGVIHY